MGFKSDIEIAQQTKLKEITEIGRELGLSSDEILPYGHYKAKLDIKRTADSKKSGKLILVTAMTPTPAGEGKTTMTIGLGDGLRQIGKKSVIALREPSLGPVFGMKGGAAGGGYAQVVPMEDINLHFTGDFHAIGAANNLLAAMLDNHIHHGNQLNIDTRRITWKRALDMNDRQLRNIVDGLGGAANGVPREDSFDITVASEIMAILCLAEDLNDLKARLSRVIVGYNTDREPVTAGQLNAAGAMTVLLKDAMQPNLVQTLEGTPAIIHGGPFANIAHGCNSVVATKTALEMGDYVVTEAGFGGDLGAEKFLNIKCRYSGLKPSAVVVVATIRALKHHGGASKDQLGKEDLSALEKGFPNLERHISVMRDTFRLPVVVAINQFPTDTEGENQKLTHLCEGINVKVHTSSAWANGGKGSMDLAKSVVELCNSPNSFNQSYDSQLSIQEKLDSIVKNIYGGTGAQLTNAAKRQAAELKALGLDKLPICVAKTQYSFSDDASLLGAPKDFEITVRELRISAGAGFIVALTGNILTMPGLPKVPSAEKIDIDAEGKIIGLF